MTTSVQRQARLHALTARMNTPFVRALSSAEVRAALGRRGMETALAHGALVRILPDTYVRAAAASTHEGRCAGALRWGRGRVLLTGPSVLHLYDDGFPPPARVHCVVEPERRLRTPSWIALTRRRPGACTAAVNGQQCVALEDAVVDAWRSTASDLRVSLVYQVLWCRVVTARALERAVAAMPRVPERGRLMSVLGEVRSGDTSPSEAMARREVFAGVDWRALEWQVGLVAAGRRRVADAVHRAARVVVEFDGAAFHENALAVRRDRERDAELAASGWLTVRFSYRDLRDRPQWCRDSLAGTVASRLTPGGT